MSQAVAPSSGEQAAERRGEWSVRARLTVAVVVATAISFALLTAAFGAVLGHETQDDAQKVLVARANSELHQLLTANDSAFGTSPPDVLDFTQAGGDRGAFGWIFIDGQLVERPANASSKEDGAAQALINTNGRSRDADESVRIYSLTPRLYGHTLTVVSGVQLGPYERSERYAIRNLVIVGLVLLALIALGARSAVRAALKPVTRMARQAASWDPKRDEPHRFSAQPHDDEFGELARTFDQLLDGIIASLRHEERFSAEVSHELRVPLASVIGEAQLALRKPRENAEYQASLATIEATGQQMLETLETLLTVARAGSVTGTVSDLGVAAQSAADDAAQIHPERDHVVLHLPEERVMAGVDADVVRRILAPVVSNAFQHGQPPVELHVTRTADAAVVRVTDAGTGLADDELDAIFEPGFQGATHHDVDPDHPGAGLGLALTRRLARAVGGDATAEPSDGSGARIVISLPPG